MAGSGSAASAVSSDCIAFCDSVVSSGSVVCSVVSVSSGSTAGAGVGAKFSSFMPQLQQKRHPWTSRYPFYVCVSAPPLRGLSRALQTPFCSSQNARPSHFLHLYNISKVC